MSSDEEAKESATVPAHMVGSSFGVSHEKIEAARVELKSFTAKPGYIIPNRGDLTDTSVHKWRYACPKYVIANLAYFKGKTREHASDSLEKVVEDLVKTWEMEASHKLFKDWTTVNQAKYTLSANMGKRYYGEEAAAAGNYNVLLDGIRKDLYDSSKETFDSSHHLFRDAFPEGFPWEVLDVFSPPPVVCFSWRHWAYFNGTYRGQQGEGEVLEMYGFARVTVDESTKICDIEVFYKPEEFLEVLEGNRPVESLKNGTGGFPDFGNLKIAEKLCPACKVKDAKY